jgi:23S rRNA (uridine2552-2'-O)-methyltransferase
MSAYTRKDAAYREAKRTGYRSRAAIKLVDLDKRYRLFRSGSKVLDLGCWPGGWLQVAAQRVGAAGRVVGIDLVSTDALQEPNVFLLVGDVADDAIRARALEALGGHADVLLSDMAPKLTGVRPADSERQLALVDLAVLCATQMLAPGGRAVVKLFSDCERDASARLSSVFRSVVAHRPPSTRKGSSEIYAICADLKSR